MKEVVGKNGMTESMPIWNISSFVNAPTKIYDIVF
jgi:hypothetical protein